MSQWTWPCPQVARWQWSFPHRALGRQAGLELVAAGARPPLRQQPLLIAGDGLGSSQHRERSLQNASQLLNSGPGALCHLLPLTVSSFSPDSKAADETE